MSLQEQRREYLIRSLIEEREDGGEIDMPANASEQKRLLRGLMNIRPAWPASPEFLQVQDAYLQEEIASKGIVSLSDLTQMEPGIYLWQGDICTLQCDAIVNAANSGLTGCWAPNHMCIDNCIHTFAGVQLRLKCDSIMKAQGHPEPTGKAKITPAYNLPCKYVLHTVGPIVKGEPGLGDAHLLTSSYQSCLELAEQNGVESLAFCCISTGVFGYPNKAAAEVAVQTVRKHLRSVNSNMKVVFNVFKDIDARIYQHLLR